MNRCVSEEAIVRLIKFEGSHCTSCHEDEAAGYWMCWINLGKGREAEVCCDVKRAYDEWCRAREKGKVKQEQIE